MHSTAPMDDATTPTRATFSRGNSAAGANRNSTGLVSQKPLPTSPFPDAVQVPEPSEKPTAQGEHSQQPTTPADSEDVDMNASEGEDGGNDDGGSDDDSLNADGTKSKNKKKSQRFYCTDYPPCNLSFTRSEHLARHIRYIPGMISCIVLNHLTSSTLCIESIRAKDRSCAIAHEGFRDLTT